MLQTIESINSTLNAFIWGVPAVSIILFTGILLSCRTKFVQFRKFGFALKNTIGRMFTKEKAKEGSITPFQAVCTALAATVGTGNIAGVAGAIAIGGFVNTHGSWVTIFTAVAMICFAFSTILGWGLYGARCVEFVFSHKAVKPFMIIYSLVCILGATVDLGLIWGIADTCNGFMAIPNLIALILMSGTVAKLTKEYLQAKRPSRLFPIY